MNMAYEKVVAAYDTAAHAQSAVAALRAGGFADADISVIDQARVRSVVSDIDTRADAHGIWHSLFGHDVHEHEAEVYHRAVQMNGVVLAVRVLDREVAHALGILNTARPIDVNDRAITSGLAEPARVEAIARKQTVAVTPKLAAVHDEVLRLAEEQLHVGKEMVQTGETRVRRFVTEREVAQDISLHEEHAQIMRRVVNDPKSIVDIDWADRTIHVVETAEHALVSKSARVVEEVELSKIGSDHVETVHEKLRRQQVEIERVGADGKRITRA
jgi:uncharacterized protein (TIGR02271 family)